MKKYEGEVNKKWRKFVSFYKLGRLWIIRRLKK